MEKYERLLQAYNYLRYKGIAHTQQDVATKMGTTQQNMSAALKGVPKVLTSRFLRRFNNAFDNIFSLDWLLTGQGEMLVEAQEIRFSVAQANNTGVPYYNVDFNMGFLLMENDQTQNPDFLIDCPPYNKCDFWCNAHGESMSPTISSGDIVALQKIDDFRYLISGEIYAIITRNGLRTIKRVNDLGKNIELVPDNRDFQPQTLPKSEITHVFAVKGAMKTF